MQTLTSKLESLQLTVKRILSECTQFCYVNYNAQNMRVSYWHGHETTLDFGHFY
jgi:hypothetical protein